MQHCPNTYEGGCRCPLHHPGLSAHAHDADAYHAALRKLTQPARRARLAAVPTPADQRPTGCTGTMVCPCRRCTKERTTRPALDAGPAAFTVRPATRAA